MDLVDDMLPFTPSWFPPSPEPFPSIMELLQDPMTAEIENFDGIFSSPAISEAIPSTNTQPSVFPCPESSTIPQISPDMQQQEPLDDSHGYLQQSDQQDLLNPNMLNCYQEPDVSTIQQQQLNLPGPLEQSDLQRLLNPNMMYSEPDFSTSLQQPPPLYDSHGYLQQSDQQDLMNQNMMNSFQGANVSTTQQQQLLCNSHGHVQGNLSNIQSDQQYLSNQNATDLFQEPNNSTMIDIGQQIEEGNNGYAHQPLIDPFELPNHHQEQFPSVPISQNYPSYPVYQHGPVGSHFNMYGQQPPPLVLTNREEEHLPPRNVTDLAR
ncbi:transcriptional regulator EFH1-like protein [Arabidopsis thaliana]|uniref:Transcriptional regulator EFH1-like protein n=1 Tax=Arabidopsis thaliana TaxID=3702 RepID=Q1PFR0_ARATH|nr:transcriptional regulator EFH1-like protein [Arabidopsis thaliana]ABE65667.1 unknown [Arabidopsis thaliana]AEE31004.1 transcriptional regulator EFH1-like protein [Arabidopsis thaliana]|eukprot:NP_001077619.1 transcriptional regulator EFH1-like protein [Arabidopsis thaliana]